MLSPNIIQKVSKMSKNHGYYPLLSLNFDLFLSVYCLWDFKKRVFLGECSSLVGKWKFDVFFNKIVRTNFLEKNIVLPS